MYSILLFYIFFCVLAISSIWIIVMRWKRYMKYSNGTYKNAGQNLIFKTELSQNEIIRKLETHDAKDTLDYDFYEKNGEYFLKVKGVKRLVCNGVQREHNKKLNNGLPILHKVPPKRDYGRYFCIMAEKGGTSHGGLTEKLSPFFHAKKQEVNAYGR